MKSCFCGIQAQIFHCAIKDIYGTFNQYLVVREITEHAVVLRAVDDKVSATIDAQRVARNMFQSNALTLKELQSIQSKHRRPVKAAEQLLNIVMNQSDNVYGCFLDALKETDHHNVFKVIVSGSYKGKHNGLCCP